MGDNSNAMARKLQRKLRTYLKHQINFKKHFRNVNRPFISRIFLDQYVRLYEHTFHVIKCRTCNKLSKAQVTIFRTCLKCSTNLRRYRRNSRFLWDSWGEIII